MKKVDGNRGYVTQRYRTKKAPIALGAFFYSCQNLGIVLLVFKDDKLTFLAFCDLVVERYETSHNLHNGTDSSHEVTLCNIDSDKP